MLYWTFIYWKQVIIINGPNPNLCLYVFGCMQSFSATISGTKQSQKVLAAIRQIIWNWNKMLSKALSQLFRQTGVFTQFCDIYQSSNILVCISVIESAAVNTESDLSIKQPFWSRSSLQPTLICSEMSHLVKVQRGSSYCTKQEVWGGSSWYIAFYLLISNFCDNSELLKRVSLEWKPIFSLAE